MVVCCCARQFASNSPFHVACRQYYLEYAPQFSLCADHILGCWAHANDNEKEVLKSPWVSEKMWTCSKVRCQHSTRSALDDDEPEEVSKPAASMDEDDEDWHNDDSNDAQRLFQATRQFETVAR